MVRAEQLSRKVPGKDDEPQTLLGVEPVDLRRATLEQSEKLRRSISPKPLKKSGDGQVEDDVALKELQAQIRTLGEKSVEGDKVLNRLWPEGEDSAMEQAAGIGTCYLVAALDALKHTHGARKYLADIVTVRPDGRFAVRLFDGQVIHHDGSKGKWVTETISPNDLKDTSEKILQSGSLGDQIITRALMRLANRSQGGRRGETVMAVPFSVNGRREERYRFEYGLAHRMIYALVGPDFQKYRDEKPESMDSMLQAIAEDRERGKNQLMAVARSKNPDEMPERWTRKLKNGVRLLLGKRIIVPEHAYRIADVDKKNVTLVNPHDTSKQEIISRQDFFLQFAEISILRPKGG